jgi:hypothetical protein
MKQIQPVTVWVNGTQQQANFLNAYIVNDNLATSATFYYELVKQELVDNEPVNTTLTNGNQTIDGQEYIDWGNSGDINDDAYVILASKLNLTLI